MTSIPASRNARAMIFAPRSWPSRPGFAITTRIFLSGTTAEYRRAPDRYRLLAGMAKPGKRAFRLSRRRPGAPPPRLRPRRPRPAARDGELAERRRDRDYALAPRPLGRPRPLGLGELLPLVERPRPEARALGPAGRRRVPRRPRRAHRVPGHVRARVPPPRVRAERAVLDGRAHRHPGARAALHARDVRLPDPE